MGQRGNGEGTIYKSSKTGLYIGQYVVNGKRKSIYQRKNERSGDFKARFYKVINSINDGSYIEKSNQSLYEIIENHINQKFEDNLVSGRTHIRDKQTLGAIKKACSGFVDLPIQKIQVEDIEGAKKYLKTYSQSVIDKVWMLLAKGFKLGVSRRKIPFNIMEDENLKKPISSQEVVKKKALTSKELAKLNNILDTKERKHKYRNIVKLQLETRNEDTEKHWLVQYKTVT